MTLKGTPKMPIINSNRKTLQDLINDWILPGTNIMPDCWKAYDHLNDNGLINRTVNHTEDPQTRVHTKNVERL